MKIIEAADTVTLPKSLGVYFSWYYTAPLIEIVMPIN